MIHYNIAQQIRLINQWMDKSDKLIKYEIGLIFLQQFRNFFHIILISTICRWPPETPRILEVWPASSIANLVGLLAILMSSVRHYVGLSVLSINSFFTQICQIVCRYFYVLFILSWQTFLFVAVFLFIDV